jgi:hypothetical protein
MTKIRAIAVLAAAITLPLSVAACSEESTGDLSKDEITKELVEAGIEEEQAGCMADAMIEIDFTKSELEDIGSGKVTSGEKYDAFFEATTNCILGTTGE